MKLTMFYDFLQVLLHKRERYMKNDYLSKQVLFSIIYLLQKQRLKHNN
jgi:hypothetical protein